MKDILVVTSWSEDGFEQYGKRWLSTAGKFWPMNTVPYVVDNKRLSADPAYQKFMAENADAKLDRSSPAYDYRQDLLRFANKIFALKVALDWVDTLPDDDTFDWLVWLDGDVETVRAPSDQELWDQILPDDHDGVLLSRAETAPHPECGFMAFNLRGKGKHFLRSYIGFYISGDVRKLSETHDSYAFMVMVLAHEEKHGSRWLDICPRGTGPHGLDAFEASPLHSFFVHKKGARKAGMTNQEIVEALLAANPGAFVVDCRMKPVEDISKLLLPDNGIYLGWYSSDEDGRHVDTTRFGVNNVKTNLTTFETQERLPDGGFCHVAAGPEIKIPDGIPIFHQRQSVIPKEKMKEITNGAYSTNMVVMTQNCVPEGQIRANIAANLKQIPAWVRHTRHHMKRAIIVSAGPSLDDPRTIEDIEEQIELGAVVFCVKHSHNKLIEKGIVPWGCVLLDPRPHEGVSTHGASRRELLQKAHPDVRYFVASMVDPDVVKRLLDTGGKVYGYHAAVGADEKSVLPPEHHAMLMGGGSSSAGRAMILAWQFLGFQSIGLYAFDSCHLDESKIDKNARHQDGTPKYVYMELTVGGESKHFWTDRDILCQAQDFTRFLQEVPWIQWDAHGPGMIAWLWQNTRGRLKPLEELYK